jgi:DNA replication protein DnaC
MLHNFGNAGLMKTVRYCALHCAFYFLVFTSCLTLFSNQAVASALERRNMRLHAAKAGNIRQTKSVTKEDVDGYTADQRKLFEDPMSVLEEMADVGDFKPQMRRLQVQAAERRAQGRDLGTLLRNWTFLGKPGTGKTTVARKMAALLHSFGLLPTDKLVETSALDLTGEFVGQSKSKMQEKMDEARGGVLFIDEAYELGAGSYGNEVMTKLVQLLTDQRYEVCVASADSIPSLPNHVRVCFSVNSPLVGHVPCSTRWSSSWRATRTKWRECSLRTRA